MSIKTIWKANPEHPEYTESRQHIIECAADIIQEAGVKKLRFDEVAQRAGCARPTLYRYFNSKEELIGAVIIHLMNINAEDITNRVKSIKDMKKRVVQIIYIGVQNMRHDPRFKLFLDPQNNQYLVHLSMDIIPDIVAPLLDNAINAEKSAITFNPSLSTIDIARWIVMQVYALGTFGPVGNSEREEKRFIEKLVIPGLFA